MAQGERVAHALLRGRGAPSSRAPLSADVELGRLRPVTPTGCASVSSSLCGFTRGKKAHVVLNVALLRPTFVFPRLVAQEYYSGLVLQAIRSSFSPANNDF